MSVRGPFFIFLTAGCFSDRLKKVGNLKKSVFGRCIYTSRCVQIRPNKLRKYISCTRTLSDPIGKKNIEFDKLGAEKPIIFGTRQRPIFFRLFFGRNFGYLPMVSPKHRNNPPHPYMDGMHKSCGFIGRVYQVTLMSVT